MDKNDNPYIDQIVELKKIPELKPVNHLSNFIDNLPTYISPCYGDPSERTIYSGGYLSDEGFTKPLETITDYQNVMYQRAGPRKEVCFDNKKVKAAILTCGGICPGLNVVIREIFMTLTYNYQVEEVYGIKFGYQGIYSDPKDTYIRLNSQVVRDIHKTGGSILGSSRGGFELTKIVDALEKNGINMLFVIGGDGTHKGIKEISNECIRRKLYISVSGIPKTIDNDIPIIDFTFGFETAVAEAVKVIDAANVEATSAVNGVGIVKLFGRSCGFISLFATLASRDVNICIIPEEKFELYGENGLLEYVIKRVQAKGHCVIVIAEGAGDAIIDYKVDDTGITDKSGNKKLPDIGVIIKNELSSYSAKKSIELTIKYIDPTYIIRAVPTNAHDTYYCARIANNAVHCSFAGWTGFTSGVVNMRGVIIPIDHITSIGNKTINPKTNSDYLNMLGSTGQPAFRNKK